MAKFEFLFPPLHRWRTRAPPPFHPCIGWPRLCTHIARQSVVRPSLAPSLFLPPSLDPAGEAWLFLPFLPLWLRGRRGGGSEPCRPRWSSSSIYCRAAALSSGPDPLAARTHHNQSILPPPAPAAFAVVAAVAVPPVAHTWRGNKMSEKGN